MNAGDSLFAGFRAGVIVGALIGFFQAKRIRRLVYQPEIVDTVRDRIDAILPTDTISQSIAEGKAVARRRWANSEFDQS